MKPTLYQLSQAGMELEDMLLSSEGELTPELESAMDALLAVGSDRIEAAAMVVRRMEAEADAINATASAIEEEARRLKDRSAAVINSANRLKNRMVHVLDHVFSGKVKTPLFTVWAQNSAGSLSFETAPEFTPQMVAEDAPELVITDYKLNRKALVERHKNGDALPESIVVIEKPGARYCRIS